MDFRIFPDFFDRPERIRFVEQESDEIIELVLRRHFITNIPWIFISLVLFLLPLLIPNFFGSIGLNLLTVPASVILGALIIWYLLIISYVIESFLHWYFNIYIVTNKHLVDINFYSLVNRDITEARLEDIQSPPSRIKGIFGSLFNFGDIVIETAATHLRIQFDSIPKPDLVVDRIQDLQHLKEFTPGGINAG